MQARRTRPVPRPNDRRPGLRPDPRGSTDPSLYSRRRQDARPADGRRVGAAALSAVVPGLGQLANGRARLAAIFALPALAVVGLAGLLLLLSSPTRLAATLITPGTLTAVLGLNVLVLVWRLASVAQAFFDRPSRGLPSRAGAVALAVLIAFVAVPHLYALQVGFAARDTFARIFDSPGAEGGVAGVVGTPAPGDRERTNILVIGIDKIPSRNATLTDTMIVVSIDPVGRTVSMVSIPRDIVGAPLGNGDVYGPKLNSLKSYADAHPAEFPQGGLQALKDAVSALLGVPIHYSASIDFFGFVKVVDTMGGVDVNPSRGFTDPEYGYRGRFGFSITAGPHHLDGLDALAYVRARRAPGESDFTRAARQQEVILALRDRALRNGSLLFQIPSLFDALGEAVRTDLPVDRLPMLAVLADEVDDDAIVRVVIRSPLVKGARNKYGAVQVPDLVAIWAVADGVFSDPGTPPRPWPASPEDPSAQESIAP